MTGLSDNSEYVATLQNRLRMAERVCQLVGATAADWQTERGKARTELWQAWFHAYGGQAVPVTDEEITELARRRDQTVADTRARIRRDYPEIVLLDADDTGVEYRDKRA